MKNIKLDKKIWSF